MVSASALWVRVFVRFLPLFGIFNLINETRCVQHNAQQTNLVVKPKQSKLQSLNQNNCDVLSEAGGGHVIISISA